MDAAAITPTDPLPSSITIDGALARHAETVEDHQVEYTATATGGYARGCSCGFRVDLTEPPFPHRVYRVFQHRVSEGLRLLASATGLPHTHEPALYQRLLIGGQIRWIDAVEDARVFTRREAQLVGRLGTVEAIGSWPEYVELVQGLTAETAG